MRLDQQRKGVADAIRGERLFFHDARCCGEPTSRARARYARQTDGSVLECERRYGIKSGN